MKNYFLLVDTETAGGFDKKLVYDIGIMVTDRQGNVQKSFGFLIDEIWNDTKIMDTAYYRDKIPTYTKEIENGNYQVKNFSEVLEIIYSLIDEYKIKTITAYNLMFDLDALQKTSQAILGETHKFEKLKKLCIWSFACEVLYTQKTYKKIATRENWLKEKTQNLLTNAEVGYRYITKKYDFIEEHKGLHDTQIENTILAKCFSQNKKHLSGVLSHPWKIPNKKNQLSEKIA
jgi:hypothetical protein